jgi:hypothetical protein
MTSKANLVFIGVFNFRGWRVASLQAFALSTFLCPFYNFL